MAIAVLGGTGPEGVAIAARLLATGNEVIIGSRAADRAASTAATLAAEVPGGKVRGARNPDAAAAAEMIVVAVPAAGMDGSWSRARTGSPARSCSRSSTRSAWSMECSGSRPRHPRRAAPAAHVPTARLVSGLKHESAAALRDLRQRLEGDVLLCGDDEPAKAIVADLIRRIPDLRPVDAGGLAVAPLLDHVTALLLNVNRRHKAETSIRLIGL